MSRKPIDQETGTINVYDLLPEAGDSLMIVNCGTHFEIRYHQWMSPDLTLTADELECLKAGTITWN